MLTIEEVRKIAKLARIKLSDDEVERFAGQLTNILEYVDILKEVDTENVEPTCQVTGLVNVMEEDVEKDYSVSREEILGCSELPIDSNQIKVIKVIND